MLDPLEKILGGVGAVVIGIFIGAIAMLRNISQKDETLRDHDKRLVAIETNKVSREELQQTQREYRDELRGFHSDVSDKLDMINGALVTIQVALVGKVDKK